METLLHMAEKDITLWTAILVLVTAAALAASVFSFRETLRDSRYAELDQMYFDLLKCALDRPHLVDPSAARSKEETAQYDIYAFMVWNFIESICDQTKKDKHLQRTWHPIIYAESRRHQAWFQRKDNHGKFKQEFHDEVAALKCFEDKAARELDARPRAH